MSGRPYHFGPRLRGALAQVAGRIHLTRNRGLGHPALLVRTEREGACQVLVTAYSGQVVAEHRAGRVDQVPSVMDVVAAAYEAALDEEQARAHLESGTLPIVRPVVNIEIRQWRPKWPRWVPHVVAAACMGALIWPSAVQHRRAREPGPSIAPLLAEGDSTTLWLTDLLRFSSAQESMTVGRVRLPDKPLPGQDTPPCPTGYVGINGGCWAELKQRVPDCPKGSAEYKGGCYLPIKGDKPVPMTIGRDARGRR